jgi:UDP-N-acetylglucosamine 2-epimerase
MIKILTVVGARPQIIKAAALSRAIKNKFADKVTEKILHTGQHYDANMSEVFFQEMNIPFPHYNLNIGSGSHGDQTAKMIQKIEEQLIQEKFDGIVLFGDTNSTLAGAVAAAKMHIPIIHIEAGLRSFNMAMPEEANRIVCDQLSTILFAPTQTGIDNLKNEGFYSNNFSFAHKKKRHVFNSGDIMYDNSLYYSSIAKPSILKDLKIENDEFVLATIHRDSNTDNSHRLIAILEGLLGVCEQNNIKIILPIHPRTNKILFSNPIFCELLAQIERNKKMQIIPPVSYFEAITLEKNAKLIMTDSGGMQKEAYFFKKPCVVFRSETEWVEIIENKAGIVTDADKDRIIKAYSDLVNTKNDFPSIFGDGHAAEFILDKIIEVLR